MVNSVSSRVSAGHAQMGASGSIAAKKVTKREISTRLNSNGVNAVGIGVIPCPAVRSGLDVGRTAVQNGRSV